MNKKIAVKPIVRKITVTKKPRGSDDAPTSVEVLYAIAHKDTPLRVQAEPGVEISVAIEGDACTTGENGNVSEPITANSVFDIEQVGHNRLIKSGNERLLEIVDFYQTPDVLLGEISWQNGACAPLLEAESTNWWPALLLLGLRGGGGGGGGGTPAPPNTAATVTVVKSNASGVGTVPTLNIGDGVSGDAGNVFFTIGFDKVLAPSTPLDANGANFELITSAGTVLKVGVDFFAQVTLDPADATGKTYKLEISLITEVDDDGINIKFLADPDGNSQAVQDEQGVNIVDQLLLTYINIDSNPTTSPLKVKVDTQVPSTAVYLKDPVSGNSFGDLVNAAEKAATAATFIVTHEPDATQVQFFTADGTGLLATANAANNWVIALNFDTLNANLDPNTGTGSYQFVTRQTDDANNVGVNSCTLDFDVLASPALVNSYVPETLTSSDFTGAAGSEVFTISGSAQEAGNVTVSWDSENDGSAELTRSFAVTQEVIGIDAWSINFAMSDLQPYAGYAGAFYISFIDTAGNTANQIQILSTQLVLP